MDGFDDWIPLPFSQPVGVLMDLTAACWIEAILGMEMICNETPRLYIKGEAHKDTYNTFS